MSFGDPRPGCVVSPVRHYFWVAYRLVVFVRPSIGVLELLGLPIGLTLLGLRNICCNGILCLDSHCKGVTLWNPATREIKSLPRTTFRHSEFWECAFTFTAFGHDPKTDDYKVFRCLICSNMPGRPIQKMELYALSSDSWRQMDLDVPAHIEGTNIINTCMKGRNHWLGSDQENGEVVILYFDMSDEVFGVIPLPNSFGYQRGDIAVYNEMIALIFYPNTYTDTDTATEKRFDMWVMSEYGVKESWTRLFTIGAVSGVERPLGFWSNGGVFMGSSSGELLLYNHFTQQFKNLGVFSVARRPSIERYMQVIIYKESLVSLNGRHEEEDGIIRVP
ncbi:F-box/kelch-repeat protein At3g06240-like [Vitis riparia]|uniref:F-box/kelch-repeat protein At3g06240-like n=1 Tax=Vitis riparia TaxID=96939 RepID=UPI00155A42A3|nr:F-box/kelch-repeat protein At3g06240-like [Vitis riparia]